MDTLFLALRDTFGSAGVTFARSLREKVERPVLLNNWKERGIGVNAHAILFRAKVARLERKRVKKKECNRGRPGGCLAELVLEIAEVGSRQFYSLTDKQPIIRTCSQIRAKLPRRCFQVRIKVGSRTFQARVSEEA